MLQTVVRFGALGFVLALIVAINEYAQFVRADPFGWLTAFSAVGLLLIGLWVGKRRFAIPQPLDSPDPKAIAKSNISKREYEVLELMAGGLSNQEIASRLFISESTVKTHVSHIFSKLGAKRRTQAITIARQKGLLR